MGSIQIPRRLLRAEPSHVVEFNAFKDVLIALPLPETGQTWPVKKFEKSSCNSLSVVVTYNSIADRSGAPLSADYLESPEAQSE
jgi:hypothetical protein